MAAVVCRDCERRYAFGTGFGERLTCPSCGSTRYEQPRRQESRGRFSDRRELRESSGPRLLTEEMPLSQARGDK